MTMIIEFAALAALIGGYWATRKRHHRGKGISILIPFRCKGKHHPRARNVEWLKKYWRAQLPEAELIIGTDPDWDLPFSKSVAVNDAVSKSSGDILVIVDADGYIPVETVLECAAEIREARSRGHRLWFVPYRQFYRLTEKASARLLDSSPKHPLKFSEPISHAYQMGGNDPRVGHWYGAMIQICPREAFDITGGWDERFRGWGGEDHAAMRAMDTMYGLHKTMPGQVLHVWHPQIGPEGEFSQVHWKDRMWEGQFSPGVNDALVQKYIGAYRRPERMAKLIAEWHRWRDEHKHCHEHRGHCHHHEKHHHHHRHHHHRHSH